MGFENVRGLGGRIQVQIPTDENGYLGRECPIEDCLGYFKVKPGTGLTGPDLPCHCPYCGHAGASNTFFTSDQVEYAKSVALRQFSEAVRKDLKGFEFDHKPKGAFGIGISMKLKPGTPIPLHRYAEKELETYVTCDQCTLEYAVYGVFGFCADCGKHNSLQILHKNLDLVRALIELADGVEPKELARQLLEDAQENCVSAFDGFGREAVAAWTHRQSLAPPKGLSFQSIEGAAKKLAKQYGVDFRSAVDAEVWATARIGFLERHLIAHRAGVVDQRHIDESGDPNAVLGRRLSVDPDGVTALSRSVAELADGLIFTLESRNTE